MSPSEPAWCIRVSSDKNKQVVTVSDVQSLPTESVHVRHLWRLAPKVSFRALPSKAVTGFRFVDPEGKFVDIGGKAEFVYRVRLARRSIHAYARRLLVEDVIQPLHVDWRVRRQPVSGRQAVEVFQLSHGSACVLATLKNWVNPVFENEISRAATALNSLGLELRDEYAAVWKYILAPQVENWQTRLDRFYDIRFYSLDYVLPESLLDSIVKKTGVDYRFAYPHRNRWDRHIIEGLQSTLGDLLQITPSVDRPAGNCAHAHTRATEPEAQDSTMTNKTLLPRPPLAECPYIVTITKRGLES